MSAKNMQVATLADIEKLRGVDEVIKQRLEDYIKKNDSKIEDAHTVANVLLGKHEDARKENQALRNELLTKFNELEAQVSGLAQVARDTTCNTNAASKQIEKAEGLITKIVDEQRKFMNGFFVRLILAFGVQVVLLLAGVLLSLHFTRG